MLYTPSEVDLRVYIHNPHITYIRYSPNNALWGVIMFDLEGLALEITPSIV